MRAFACSYLLTVVILLFQHARSIVVTGISANVNKVTGERPLRLNINQLFMSGGPPWDLFVLALREFQQTSQDDPLSYYQIAGIHGFPQLAWDGVSGAGEHPGYCAHAAVTFPTWHRSYLALFEQTLWKHAQRIAKSYPVGRRESYTAAALRLRMPYWDAFADANLPPAASSPTTRVETPNGIQELKNPLYQYTFHAEEGGNRFPTDHWAARIPSTVRHRDSASGQSNINAASADLENQHQNLLDLTYKLFASETDYTRVSCTTSGGNSVENIHNSVHNAVGGNGHMSDSAAAAFDPIFWLHHANMDRLLAIWQAINPQSWLVPTMNTVGSYAVSRGHVENGDSPLYPFHSNNESGFWTSDMVRSTRIFGYTYPELIDWNVSVKALSSDARAIVNKLYDPLTARPQTRRRRSAGSPHKADPSSLRSHTADNASTIKEQRGYRQWTINLELPRRAYRSPFFIDFFLGTPPDSPTMWSTASNLVGSHAQFIATCSEETQAKSQQSTLTHGEVLLTSSLKARVRAGILASLEPSLVVPLLTETLNWRARDMEGNEIALDFLAALSVEVGSQLVEPRPNDFPRYKELELYSNITASKVMGRGYR